MQARISFRSESHIYKLPDEANIAALKDMIERNLNLPQSHQKLLYKGKQLTDDAKVPDSGAKIMLLASSQESIAAVQIQSQQLAQAAQRRAAAPKITARLNTTPQDFSKLNYRFHRITALRHLPDSKRSLQFLEKLANDGSIKKLMTRHHYSVGHLTEMDPRLYTQHGSKTLGLNKNAGQEILLRLRTDTLDGWRDYKTVRLTLIHELAHNEFGEHDQQFWALFNALSREVAEYESGNKLQPGKEVYIPEDAKHSDSGALWTGGTGTVGGAAARNGTHDAVREGRAKAAEERMKK